MAEFFLDYRRTALAPTELIVSLLVPPLRPREHIEAYKQARRREDDVAIVNACMRVKLSESDPATVEEVYLAYGGVNKKVIRAESTEKALVGLVWGPAVLDAAMAALPGDIPLPCDAPGGGLSVSMVLLSLTCFGTHILLYTYI